MNFKETLAEKTVHAEDVLTKYLPEEKGYQKKVIESMNYSVLAGGKRLRPILMTTLTTVVSMIPMAMAYGDSGESMQGLALVDVGGLIASTILALLMLPVYYSVMSRKKKPEPHYD